MSKNHLRGQTQLDGLKIKSHRHKSDHEKSVQFRNNGAENHMMLKTPPHNPHRVKRSEVERQLLGDSYILLPADVCGRLYESACVEECGG